MLFLERVQKLLENTGVLLFPGTLFGDVEDKYIRLSYLQPINKIEESITTMSFLFSIKYSINFHCCGYPSSSIWFNWFLRI